MFLRELNDELQFTDLINNYAEDCIDPFGKAALAKVMDDDPHVASLAQKSRRGRIALKRAYTVEAADDFEEKLARRIVALQAES